MEPFPSYERNQPEDEAATWKRPDLRNSEMAMKLIPTSKILSISWCSQLLEAINFLNCLSLIELSFPLLVIESILNKNPRENLIPFVMPSPNPAGRSAYWPFFFSSPELCLCSTHTIVGVRCNELFHYLFSQHTRSSVRTETIHYLALYPWSLVHCP